MFFLFSVQVDFASQESQMAFYRSMQASGQDIRDFYEIPTERRQVLHLVQTKLIESRYSLNIGILTKES